jgi:hypothetical protein
VSGRDETRRDEVCMYIACIVLVLVLVLVGVRGLLILYLRFYFVWWHGVEYFWISGLYGVYSVLCYVFDVK